MSFLPLIITPQKVRNELSAAGMDDYWSVFTDPDNFLTDVEYQNKIIEEAIGEAQGEIESECEIYLTQRVVCSSPVPPDYVRGVDYDVAEPRYPYFNDDWIKGGKVLVVNHRPLVKVHFLKLQYGGMSSSNTIYNIMDIPENWISWDAIDGWVYCQPLYGASNGTVAGTLGLAMLGQTVMRRDVSPNIISIKYTAGLLPKNFNPATDDPSEFSPDFEIRDIIKAIRFMATASLLMSLNRAMGAGGGSISLDGLSESFNANRFKDEIADYKKDVKDLLEKIKSRLSSGNPKFGIF